MMADDGKPKARKRTDKRYTGHKMGTGKPVLRATTGGPRRRSAESRRKFKASVAKPVKTLTKAEIKALNLDPSKPQPRKKSSGPSVRSGENKPKRVGLETPHQKGMAKRKTNGRTKAFKAAQADSRKRLQTYFKKVDTQKKNRLKARARGIQSGRMGQEQRILKSGGKASWLRGFRGGGGSDTAGQPLAGGPSKGRRPGKLQ
jgi:hypothetical protein